MLKENVCSSAKGNFSLQKLHFWTLYNIFDIKINSLWIKKENLVEPSWWNKNILKERKRKKKSQFYFCFHFVIIYFENSMVNFNIDICQTPKLEEVKNNLYEPFATWTWTSIDIYYRNYTMQKGMSLVSKLWIWQAFEIWTWRLENCRNWNYWRQNRGDALQASGTTNSDIFILEQPLIC